MAKKAKTAKKKAKKKPAARKRHVYILKDIETGEVIKKSLRPAFVLENMDVLRQITINGRKYQRLVDRELREAATMAANQRRSCQAKWPYASDAMGVHPSQIKEAQKRLAKLGVHVNYTKDGRAIVENPKHRKQLAEAMGLHDRNSYGGRGEARYRPYNAMHGFGYESPE